MPKKKITLERLAQMTKKGFDEIEEKMATKDDLKKMATKEDLKKMATKDDLKKMATKEDLAGVEERLTRQISALRGDLVLIVRKEDKKLETLIKILKRKNILSESDIKQISRIRVFPKIEISA